MQYIAALVSRGRDGTLGVDKASVRQEIRQEAGIYVQEVVGSQPGDMTGVWEYSGKEQMSPQDAHLWVEMTFPDHLYVRASWGEHVRIVDYYRKQIEGSD